MIPLHQLLVNFLFVCSHLIASLLWHFVFEILLSCLLVGGGGTCLMRQAYDTGFIIHVKLLPVIYSGKEVQTIWISFFLFLSPLLWMITPQVEAKLVWL